MSNALKSKKDSKKQTNNKKQTPKNLPLMLTAAAVVCVVAAVLMFGGNPKDGADNKTAANNGSQGGTVQKRETQVIGEGENLVISVDEVGGEAQFYPIEVDGTEMEVLAIKDSDGYVRTAFNTCESCYDSGYGYYVQSGKLLVCQNCTNVFTVNDVEVKGVGGCNPYPIFAEDKIITEESVSISYDFLKESKAIFASWKR